MRQDLKEKNGMFIKFLERELGVRERVDLVLQKLQSRFHLETSGAVLQQIPTVTSDLAEDLTLHDPVDWDDMHGRFVDWDRVNLGPQECDILIDGRPAHVSIEYAKMSDCFRNGLEVALSWKAVGFVDTFHFCAHPSTLKVSSSVQQSRVASKCTVTVSNLQTLAAGQRATLSVTIGSHRPTIIPLDLGLPLMPLTTRK